MPRGVNRRQSETATFDRLKRQYVEWDAHMLPRPKEHGRVRPGKSPSDEKRS